MIGTNQLFWPERLAHLLTNIANTCPEKWGYADLAWVTESRNKNDAHYYEFAATPPDQEQLSKIINRLKQLSDNEIHQLIDKTETALQLKNESPASLLSWQQMATMCASGLIEAGGHTYHHIRLNDGQDEDTLQQEIVQCKSQIEQQLGKSVDTFCYPNGDTSSRAIDLVKQHYQCAVTTNRGWNTAATDEYLLNRIGVHEDISHDKTAFLARLSGWL